MQPLAILFTSLIFALACAVVFGIVVLHQPLALVLTIWQGAWASLGSAAVTIAKTPPLLLTGLSVAVAYRSGLLNIGCEGQLTSVPWLQPASPAKEPICPRLC